MDSISEFFKYFINKENKPKHKAIIVFIVLLGFFFLDNTLNFSNHYNNTRKLDQIEKIGKIISDPSLDNEEVIILKKIRRSLIYHKTFKDKVYNFITKFEFKTVTNKNNVDVKFTVSNWHYWLHFITAGLPFILIGIVRFLADLNVKSNFIYTLFRALFELIQLLLLAFVWSKLLALIPIFSNPIYNYLINISINIILVYVCYRGIVYLERKEAYIKYTKDAINK